MKRYLLTVISVSAVLSFAGCQREDNYSLKNNNAIPYEIIASADPETRTANDNMRTKWVADDEVNLFHALTSTSAYISDGKFTIPASHLSSNRFKGSLSSQIIPGKYYDWYIFYPYKSGLTSPDNSTNAAYTIGSLIDSEQVQAGNDSRSHLAGENFPMFGHADNVEYKDLPNITMNHLSSVVEVEVTNDLDDDIAVTGIEFTAPEDIAGLYYINCIGEQVTYNSVQGAVSGTAKLKVNGGGNLSKGASAKFYLGIKPFVAASGSEISVKVRTSSAKGSGLHTKVFKLGKNFTFASGKMKTVKVLYTTPIVKEEVLWAETWDTGERGQTIDAYKQGGVTVYGGASVVYSSTEGTKLFNSIFSTINLLLGKSKGTFTVSGIPTAGARSAVLTFKTNHKTPDEYVLSSTSGLTISGPAVSGEASPYSVKYEISIPDGLENFNLTFTNSTDKNVRIDDINLVGALPSDDGQQGGGATPSGTVVTENVTGLGASYVTLNASFSGATAIVRAGFRYGTSSDNLDQEVTCASTLSGVSGNYSMQITGLQPAATYYFKAFIELRGTGEYSSQTLTAEGIQLQFTTSGNSSGGGEAGSGEAALHHNWLELPAKSQENLHYHYVAHRAQMQGRLQRNYSILYDDSKFTSYWVAYPLCLSHMAAGREEFWGLMDPEIDENLQTKLKKGYGVKYGSNNRYARGHQIPNADRNNVPEMQKQTYYPTNMTPQIDYRFNGGIWKSLEEKLREYAKSTDTLYVVTGAAFNKALENLPVTTITNSNDDKKLPVPNYYWKVALKVKRNGSGNVTSASAIGFWFDHKEYYKDSFNNYSCSVDQIEQWTGFNFFVNLSEAIQTSAEGNTDLSAFENF